MKIKVKHLRDENLTAKAVAGFKFNEGNRKVEEKAVKKTVSEIYDAKTRTWNQVKPIEVNILTNNILDGQHRWTAFLSKANDGGLPKEATIPVHFVKVPKEQELAYIQLYNQCKRWTAEDYVNSQIAEGNENSRKLRTFCEEHSLCHTVKNNGKVAYHFRAAVAILMGGRREDNVKRGDFVFPEENRMLAETVHDELVEILNTFPTWTKGKANIEAMAKAWYEVRSLYDFGDWKKAIKKNSRGPMTMNSIGANTWKQYFAQCAGTIALGKVK